MDFSWRVCEAIPSRDSRVSRVVTSKQPAPNMWLLTGAPVAPVLLHFVKLLLKLCLDLLLCYPNQSNVIPEGFCGRKGVSTQPIASDFVDL